MSNSCSFHASDQATSSSWTISGATSLQSCVASSGLQAQGCGICRPTHQNPIEQAFAKIKHWMRAAQKRTVDELWRHIGDLISQIQAPECSNYFANAGYASIKL